MHDWIPLLQSLVWPAFITFGILYFQDDVRHLLETTRDRLARGGAIKLGPGGFELGEIQAPSRTVSEPDTRQLDGLPHSIYMTHWAERAPDLDTEGKEYYRLRIALDSDLPEELRDVERVLYHLHPTFRNPDRESTNRAKAFEIRTAGWGEFNMTAEIFRRGHTSPLVVERYINFLPPTKV